MNVKATINAFAAILPSLVVAVLVATPAAAQYGTPPGGDLGQNSSTAGMTPEDLKKVRFDQRLGAPIPLDLPFRDEAGRAVVLKDYFDGSHKPVILALVYYECPMLCTEVLNGLVAALKPVSLDPAKDFRIVTVSFNPAEQPDVAFQKKRAYVQRYQRPAADWHFLTGEQAAIAQLTDAVGFHYTWNPALNQYAHAAGIMVATPDGRLSKYFYGVEYSPRDLRLALVDASGGRIGNAVDQVLLYCYHYDPTTGKYGLVAMRLIRIGGVLTVAVLGSFIVVMLRRDRKAARRRAQPGSAE
jgi:protein SCO1/2